MESKRAAGRGGAAGAGPGKPAAGKKIGKELRLVALTALLFLSEISALHANNKHTRYDFQELVRANPALEKHVFVSHKTKDLTVDWSDENATLQVNRALLMSFYAVNSAYDVPPGYLVPPVPSRVDYLHIIASDILGLRTLGAAEKVKGLDVGCGANCIYSLLGASPEFSFNMVGSDVSREALDIARRNADASAFKSSIDLRFQPNPKRIFDNVVAPDESFSFVMTNPPFFASAKAAQAASTRKTRNLKLAPTRNFGGHSRELWVDGGELSFVAAMIAESSEAKYRGRLGWCTSLVSDKKNVRLLQDRLPAACRAQTHAIKTGNKEATVLAWRFD